MCGIFGAITKNGLKPEKLRDIKESLSHRGPDGEGLLNFILANGAKLDFMHLRLAIIDLSKEAAQPMSYASGELWIIYNGEIYNYKEIREELKLKGYRFNTQSDTEVILASYQEWQEECVRHFNGDWAFCIFDKQRKKIFLSRDRLAVKPLYYYSDGENFAFSSEIKALLRLDCVRKAWDYDTLGVFILLGIADFSSRTLYKDIFQLGAGENLSFDLVSHKIKLYRYWQPLLSDREDRYNLKEELRHKKDIRDILEDAVKIRLRADVGIGTCLSGGLDSSLVSVIINNLVKKDIPDALSVGKIQRTFSAIYPKDKINEEGWVKRILDFTKLDGKFIAPTQESFQQDLNDLIYLQDEPFYSTSVYSQYKVMQLASGHVKVVLDGQGADELFGGYPYYQEYLFNGNPNLKSLFKGIRRMGFLCAPDALRKSSFFILYRSKIKKMEECFNHGLNYEFIYSVLKDSVPGSLSKALYVDETKYNLQQLLKYEDRNSMRFGIESRVPFTDYRLVEYALNIPVAYKIHNGWAKYILRKAAEDLLPKETVWRRDKIAFQTPEIKWLVSDEGFRQFLLLKDIKHYNGDRFWWRLYNFFLLDK